MAWKPPVNYRLTAVPTVTPEPFIINAEGVALLAEAPADVASLSVVVGATPYTRVGGTPTPGSTTYRVVSQTVVYADLQPHTEYLPLLQFPVADAGKAGACSYSRAGTVYTAEWFDSLLAHLTPLTGIADEAGLPPATMDRTERGYPGDVAFLEDGSQFFSDGTGWVSTGGGAGTTRTRMATVPAGAAVLGAVAVSVAVDANVAEWVTRNVTADADAYVADANQRLVVIDSISAAVSALQTLVVPMDAAVMVRTPVAVSAGAAVAARLPAVVSAEAAVRDTKTQVVTAQVAVQDTKTQSIATVSAYVDSGSESTAPSVGTLGVANASSTSLTGITASATDAVGVTGYKIVEQAADSGWPSGATVLGQGGWTAITSTTSWSASNLTFTSAASSSGTRYFRIYVRDAAGNVGVSATDSAYLTLVSYANHFARASINDGEAIWVRYDGGGNGYRLSRAGDELRLYEYIGGSGTEVWADQETTVFDFESTGDPIKMKLQALNTRIYVIYVNSSWGDVQIVADVAANITTGAPANDGAQNYGTG